MAWSNYVTVTLRIKQNTEAAKAHKFSSRQSKTGRLFAWLFAHRWPTITACTSWCISQRLMQWETANFHHLHLQNRLTDFRETWDWNVELPRIGLLPLAKFHFDPTTWWSRCIKHVSFFVFLLVYSSCRQVAPVDGSLRSWRPLRLFASWRVSAQGCAFQGTVDMTVDQIPQKPPTWAWIFIPKWQNIKTACYQNCRPNASIPTTFCFCLVIKISKKYSSWLFQIYA